MHGKGGLERKNRSWCTKFLKFDEMSAADFDLAYASITELAPRLAAGEISPVDLVEVALARIEQYDDLNAFITVTGDAARKNARSAELEIRRGAYRGPLHGIPIAVKDLFATHGERTTFGSPLFSQWVPDYDATVVTRLRQAGAIIVGKTNLDELAFGSTTSNRHFGATRNPWNRSYHAGGSSGGSAVAVASGQAVGALGSDTGVSIRQPAASCGIVGLKPTFGLVSKFGALPLSWSLDHVGPMARTVGDTATMLQVLAGFDERDPSSARSDPQDYVSSLDGDVRGSRIGVARPFFFDDCDAEVVAAVEAALRVFDDMGAVVEEIALPDMDAAIASASVMTGAEAAAYHAGNLRERPDAYGPEVKAWLETGVLYSAVDYLQAQRLRHRLIRETNRLLAGFDAIVMPTSPVPPTPLDDEPPGHGMLRWRNTGPFIILSLPAISIPCGFTSGGLPIGLQIVGHMFNEAGLLRLARAFERATTWHTRRPTCGF